MANMIVFATFLTVACFVQHGFAWSGCPRAEDMVPCVCQRPRGFTNVTCRGPLKDVEEGIRIISKRWLGVDEFNIISKELTVIGKRHFGMADIHNLVLFTPNLKTIDPEAFRTMERDFNRLRIYQSSISMLTDVLPALKELFRFYELLINHSPNIKAIPNDAFTGVFQTNFLYIMNLDYNSIRSVGDNAFFALPALQQLSLKGNKIVFFSPSAIHPPANRITFINLSHNQMTQFPAATIKHMNYRSNLYLGFNQIKTINLDDLRDSAERPVYIHIADNPINCDESFKTLALFNKEHRGLYMNGNCSTPSNLAGRAFHKLNVTDFS